MAKRLADIGDGGALLVADGVTELPFPPTSFGVVPDAWGGGGPGGIGVVPTLDVHFIAVDDLQLSDVHIFAGKRFGVDLVAVNPDEGDLDAAADEVTVTGHAFFTGDGPLNPAPDATLMPSGLDEETGVYVVVVDPNTIKLATSVANALNGDVIDLDDPRRAELDLASLAAGNIDLVLEAILPGVAGLAITIDIVFDAAGAPTLSEVGNAVTLHVKDNVTTNGDLAAVLNTSTKLRVKTDTVTPAYVLQAATDNFAATNLAFSGSYSWTLTPAAAVRRFHWSDLGSLGTLTLGAQRSATVSIDHRPGVVAYAATGTFDGVVEATIQMDPIEER